jgi:hypothetical protein
MGTPAFLATASMMRRLAWWGTTRSTSAAALADLLQCLVAGHAHAVHGLLEDLLAFELPLGLAEDAVLVRVSAPMPCTRRISRDSP